MKREIKETKKSPHSSRKPKVSEPETLPKKAKPAKGKSGITSNVNSKAKKVEAKNSTSKTAAGKAVQASVKTVERTAKKKTVADVSKTKNPTSLKINQKNNTKVQKSPSASAGKSAEKKKSLVVKAGNKKPKASKKPVAKVEDKKLKSIKKVLIAAKEPVRSKSLSKAAKIEKREAKKPVSIVLVPGKAPKAKKILAGTVKTSKSETQKKSIVTAKSEKTKTQAAGPKASVKKSKPTAPKIQQKIVINTKALKTADKHIKVAAPVQKAKTQPASSVLPVRKAKAVEQKVVSEKAVLPKKPVIKKAKPISSAVLRGKKGRYDFEVFPLDANFEAVSAIYVITKRITDKRKRGHHKLVCIGQTESIVDGIKMHKKDKCIKQNDANVICLLKEESEKNRLKIADDLREAHAISCNRQ